MPPWAALILYSGTIILVAAAGGLIPLMWRDRDRDRDGDQISRFVSFGAGVILGTAFLGILPEALALAGGGTAVALAALLGFLTVYLAENFFIMHACREGDCEFHTVGTGSAAFFGLSLHSLIDGVALGAGMEASAALGFITFFAILVHKAPAAFTLSSVLLREGRSPRRIVRFLAAFSLAVPLGALLSAGGANLLGERALGLALAFSAGTFLEVGAGDLLPEVHRAGLGRGGRLLAFLTGVLVAGLAAALH